MAETTLEVIINAKNKTGKVFDDLDKGLEKTSKISQETTKNLKMIGTVGGAAILAVGGASIKMAADFEKGMSNVSTLVDTTTEDMEKMKKEVLDISKKTPVALDDLTSSLYDIRSAGIEADSAMGVLTSSAMLATAGLGTTEEATDLLTSAINAFGLEADESKQLADVFFKAVKSGKTTVAELTQGFGQVAPLMDSMNIKYEEFIALTAAATTTGLDASVAYTQQRAMLSNLIKPTKEMNELMEKANITNIESQLENEGLIATVVKLTDAAGGNNEMLAKAFGSVEALNMVKLISNGLDEKTIEILADMTEGNNALNEAYDKQLATTTAQYKVLKNQLNAEMIKLGAEILPHLITVMKDGILIIKEWKLWFDKTADALGTFIFKVEQARIAYEKFKRGAIGVITLGTSEIFRPEERASGGPVKTNKTYLVGEQGPELFTPSQSGRIISNNQLTAVPTRSVLSGSGQTVYNTVNLGGNYLSEDVAEQIGDLIIKRLQTNALVG